eukprot:1157458-Pelagomonas_calceolata.AAC.6
MTWSLLAGKLFQLASFQGLAPIWPGKRGIPYNQPPTLLDPISATFGQTTSRHACHRATLVQSRNKLHELQRQHTTHCSFHPHLQLGSKQRAGRAVPAPSPWAQLNEGCSGTG